MTNRCLRLFGIVLFIWFGCLPTVTGQEKIRLFIICHDKELFLIKSDLKVAMGECRGLDWFADFEVAPTSGGKGQKHTIRETVVLQALAKNRKKNFEPKPLEYSEFDTISKNAGREQKVSLRLNELPLQLRDFLEGIMRLIITSGAQYGDGKYVERSRFTITAKYPIISLAT